MIERSLRWGVLAVMAAAGLAMSATSAMASPVTFKFGNITNNNSINAGTGSQYQVTVAAVGTTHVSFHFENVSSPGAITGIYFYDGAILNDQNVSIVNNGTNFVAGGSPGHLPGGDNWGLPTSSIEFHATTSGNPHANGISAGQSVTITIALQSGKTFDDVIQFIHNGMGGPFHAGNPYDSESMLVVGIRVQSFSQDNDLDSSEGFVIVPLPAPVWMGLAGLGGVILVRKRYYS